MNSTPGFKIWLMALRPKTLPAAVAPVVIGTAMAFGDGRGHALSAVICLLCALLIQIGTNLANDYYDFLKGTDRPDRIGPVRATQAGLVSPKAMKTAFIGVFALSVVLSLYLVSRGGWPIILIGILSIASGILYTAGPYPLGYLGLGELFVLIFFGPVAVAGTYYVQSHVLSLPALLAGIGVGFISVSMLAVNNYRDIQTDTISGKRTLAVRLGPAFAQMEFMLSIFMASVIPFVIYALDRSRFKIIVCAFLFIIALPAFKDILHKTDGPSLNGVLAYTGKLLLIYSGLFSLVWVI